ncbi:MAG: beta-lactamase family protein [Flavobacteriaceae bacterium]|nr:beta-lactamase family protein [Flavobacteriaceae bacterium]
MKNYIFPLFLACLCLSACQENKATTPEKNTNTNPKTLQLDTLYTELFNQGSFNGSVLIAEKGNIIFQKSYGIANEKSKQALNDSSIFELASISKQFTAMGIVQRAKEGQLRFDDEVAKYIPELKVYEGVTIHHLLNHTSGLPDYMDLADQHWDKSQIVTNEDILKLFEELKPEANFEPNEKWEYSNMGYLVLGSIIERVSGQKFGDYLQQKIFQPLGMKHTFVYRRRFEPKEVDNYAQGYIYSDSLQKKILPDDLGKETFAVFLDGIVGDGMVNSNPIDLLKWDRALYSNILVNDEDRELIFSSTPINDSTETHYGYGWMIDSSNTYGKIVAHSGGWAGYVNYFERHLDNNKTIIILQNNALPATEIPRKETRSILYNEQLVKPLSPVSASQH